MKQPVLKVPLSDKELNYLDMALTMDIGRYDGQKLVGNMAHLLWFTKRLRGKLSRMHTDWHRSRMGEKRWKAHRKRVNKFIRNARKSQ